MSRGLGHIEAYCLFYRFSFQTSFLGGETPSLLPFSLSSELFGRRDAFSTTVFSFRRAFRAERRLLYYLFSFPQTNSVTETHSPPQQKRNDPQRTVPLNTKHHINLKGSVFVSETKTSSSQFLSRTASSNRSDTPFFIIFSA